jgi:hypothetical protein
VSFSQAASTAAVKAPLMPPPSRARMRNVDVITELILETGFEVVLEVYG